ncbi:MAG: hypothetical protein ACF8NJ_06790 [Phycisphaerales bacterium JB038]
MYDDHYDDLDPEGPSAEDLERFSRADASGESGTVRCQDCRREIFDDADVCPHCGAFQLRKASKRGRIVIAIVALIVLLAFLFGYVI